MDTKKKYWAFVSYSHQDNRVCEWLHAALENFRVPKRLIGRETRDGAVPSRLFPVFRDRDELPGSSELGKNLSEALSESRYLIVICSPASARSRWVNEEIREFKTMGGEGRVLALIVDGEPNAADKPECGLLECFPEALKYRIGPDGTMSSDRVEPIAADIRKGRETKAMALLRLIAGLLGIPFDELRQRDKERNRRVLAFRIAALATITLLVASGAFWKYRQDRMERLEDLGREAMMQSRPTNAALYLAETYKMGNNSRDVRIMLEQAMRSVDMLSAVHAEEADGYRGAMFSDDGTRVIASSKNGSVSIWRADNGQQLLRLKADAVSSRSARFLPGGREIALLYQDGRVEIIDARTGDKLREAKMPPGYTPNPDPPHPFLAVYKQLGRAGQSDQLMIYDLQKLQVAREIKQACFDTSPISADGRNYFCLASGDDAAGVFVYAINSAAPAKQILPGTEVSRFQLSQDGRYAVAGSADGALKVISLSTQKILLSVRDPAGFPRPNISSDGRFIASAGATGTILVWSVASGELQAALAAHTGQVKWVDFLGDGNRLASLGNDGTLKTWNLQNASLISVAEPRHGLVVNSSVSPDGEKMVTYAAPQAYLGAANIDPALKVWDLSAAGPIDSFGNAQPVAYSEINESKARVIFHGKSKSTVWDIRSGHKVFEASAQLKAPISSNIDGSRIAADAGVFNLTTGKKIFSFSGHNKAPIGIWSRDGKTIASVSEELIKIWDVEKGVALAEIARNRARAEIALSANGKRLAVISAHGATLYDSHTGGKVAASNDQFDEVWDVESSIDGTVFRFRTVHAIIEIDAGTAKIVRRHDNISGFGGPSACHQRVRLDSRADNNMVVTDLAGNKSIATLSGHNSLSEHIDCDSAMRFYLTGGKSGAAILWNAETAKPILRFAGHSQQIGGVGFLSEPGQFITTSEDGTFLKWSFNEETRHPATIARRIACRVPLELDGYTLRSRVIDRDACLRERAW